MGILLAAEKTFKIILFGIIPIGIMALSKREIISKEVASK
jgi:hypothetical protein